MSSSCRLQTVKIANLLMRLSVPEPLYYLVRTSFINRRVIQKLAFDEWVVEPFRIAFCYRSIVPNRFPTMMQNYWEDGLRHRIEGNNRMAYICFLSFFHILNFLHAFRKDVLRKIHWTPGRRLLAQAFFCLNGLFLTKVLLAVTRMMNGRIQEIAIVSNLIIDQSGFRQRRSRQRQ